MRSGRQRRANEIKSNCESLAKSAQIELSRLQPLIDAIAFNSDRHRTRRRWSNWSIDNGRLPVSCDVIVTQPPQPGAPPLPGRVHSVRDVLVSGAGAHRAFNSTLYPRQFSRPETAAERDPGRAPASLSLTFNWTVIDVPMPVSFHCFSQHFALAVCLLRVVSLIT